MRSKVPYVPLETCVNGGVYDLGSQDSQGQFIPGEYRCRGLEGSIAVFRRATNGFIGLRSKFHHRFLFEEYHWDTGTPYGTVRPGRLLGFLPEGIAPNENDCPPGGDSWAERDGVLCGTVRRWFTDPDKEEPHGHRVGFEDRWVDTGERLPDDLFPRSKPNWQLFEFLATFKVSHLGLEPRHGGA